MKRNEKKKWGCFDRGGESEERKNSVEVRGTTTNVKGGDARERRNILN